MPFKEETDVNSHLSSAPHDVTTCGRVDDFGDDDDASDHSEGKIKGNGGKKNENGLIKGRTGKKHHRLTFRQMFLICLPS